MEHQWGANMHQWDTTGGCIQQYGLRFRPKMVTLMINLPLTWCLQCRHGALTLDAPMFSVYMKMLLQLMHRSKWQPELLLDANLISVVLPGALHAASWFFHGFFYK